MHILFITLILILSFTPYGARVEQFFGKNFSIISRIILFLSFATIGFLFTPQMLKDTGERAMDLLWFLLFLPILAKVLSLPIAKVLMRYRKELGILMGMLAVIHSILYLAAPQLESLSSSLNNSTTIEQSGSNDNYREIQKRPVRTVSSESGILENLSFPRQDHNTYILPWNIQFWINNGQISYLGVGMVATFFTFLLLITSNVASMKLLGRKWKMLHRTVYIIVIFTVLHVVLLKGMDIGNILLLVAYFTGKGLEWSGKSYNILPKKTNITP